ncbi:carbohydrate ABC transporter permease [Devosia sp. PTR5]|uniref:Maltose/maltodextrin transport system permease protein MalG n=1 Tax=Devosia oryzisoli TaxID=2774138 RepID=A0A927FXT0_9HYPH|nr:carbohydrate ABC transporter permease [Devosia oryzisoli]MBD8066609.1 carbohydrate ABC transporter permease [Devosia oryzisoli]
MRKPTVGSVAKWVALVLFCVWTIVPIALVVLNSFKKAKDIFTTTPTLFFTPTLDNYVNAFTKANFGLFYLNSIVVALVSTVIVIVVGTFAAYALTNFRLPFANAIAGGFLLGKLVPVISILLPLFVMINAIGLRGTLAGPIIAHAALNLPFVIWLMMGFIRDVPRELAQAAMIDGCTRMQIFWKVIFPIILPGVAAAFVLSMQYSWNELLFSLQLTTLDTYTLPVGIASFVGAISVDWGLSSAAATATMVPLIIVGFFVQKHIAQGTTGGAVKG